MIAAQLLTVDDWAKDGHPDSLWRAFVRRRLAFSAFVLLALLVLVGIAYPVLPFQNPDTTNLLAPLQGPSWHYVLGTDQLGRDQLSRLVAAERISLWAALQATVVGFVCGVPLGLASGFRGGRIDGAIARAFDSLQSIPPLILAIAIVAVLGRELTPAMVAVGFVFSPTFYRVSRSAAATVASETFVEAARSMGHRTWRIVTGHVLGNVAPLLIVQTSTAFAFGILAEAALSYLGLGVQPPDASLGSMLASAADLLYSSPQLTVEPGLVIMLLVLCLSLASDGLRAVAAGE